MASEPHTTRSRPGPVRQGPGEPLGAVDGARSGVGRDVAAHRAEPDLRRLVEEALHPGQGPPAVRRDHERRATALVRREARDRPSHLFVGEADGHVHGPRRQIPGLDDRDLGRLEPLADLGRRLGAGQDQAVGTARQDGGDGAVHLFRLIRHQAKDHEVSGGGQFAGHGLDRLIEDRGGNSWDKRGYQAAAVRRQPAGEQVGDIAGLTDRGEHTLTRGLGDDLRIVQDPRDGGAGNLGQARDVVQGGAACGRGPSPFPRFRLSHPTVQRPLARR